MVSPNFDLAFARLETFSELELESYICFHGRRNFHRRVLRELASAVRRPEYPERKDVYLALAIFLYQYGNTRTVIQALQWEGYIPEPPRDLDDQGEGALDMAWWVTNVDEPRWWTAYEWALGSRHRTFQSRRVMNRHWQPL